MSAPKENRGVLEKIEQARSIVRIVEQVATIDSDMRQALIAVDVLLDDAGDLIMDEAEKPAAEVRS